MQGPSPPPSDHAARNGADTGVPVATDHGRALYRRPGWTTRSPVAHVPEPDPEDRGRLGRPLGEPILQDP